MSGGLACTERSHRPRWRVVMRHFNCSAFNGYHRTPSAFSQVLCLECGINWRTSATYVEKLPDLGQEQVPAHDVAREAGLGLS